MGRAEQEQDGDLHAGSRSCYDVYLAGEVGQRVGMECHGVLLTIIRLMHMGLSGPSDRVSLYANIRSSRGRNIVGCLGLQDQIAVSQLHEYGSL